MLPKRFVVLFLFVLLQLKSFSLDHSKRFELILNPSQATSKQEGIIVVEVYNGYELLMTKPIDCNTPAYLWLDLFCNYTVVIKHNGRESMIYRISTEVPPRVKKEWKLTLSLPDLSNSGDASLAQVKERSINYQEDGRAFNVVETKSPMAAKNISISNNPSLQGLTN